MKLLKIAAAASLSIFFNPPSQAEEPIKVFVGSPTVDASFIEPFEALYDLIVFETDGSSYPNGFWKDKISQVAIEDKTLLRRKVTLYNKDGDLVFDRVHLADAKNLDPLRVEQAGFLPVDEMGLFIRYYHQEFKENEVFQTVVLDNGGPVIQAPIPIDEKPFDYSIWATLLMSLPFVEGAQYEIPILAQNQVVWETVTIGKQESVELKDGTSVEAWKVSTKLRPWVVWLRKERPYAVNFSQQLHNGKTPVSVLVNEHSN